MYTKFIAFVVIAGGFLFTQTFSIQVDPKLLDSPDPQTIILILKASNSDALQVACAKSYPSRAAKAKAVKEALQKFAADSQAPVISILEKLLVKLIPYWIINAIIVPDIAWKTLEAVLTELDKFISKIVAEVIMPLPVFGVTPVNEAPTNFPWNIRAINANKVWGCKRGEEIIIAIIDTGVLYTHQDLFENYVGKQVGNFSIGWHDAVSKTIEPVDGVGHGTHCTGVFAGRGYIGVAPRAKWIACRACTVVPFLGCLTRHLMECAEWIVCPDENCEFVPFVVSNSWGGEGNDTSFNDIIAVWKCVGIIPVFAIGNTGPQCGDPCSPGMQPNVIGVGSSNETNDVSTFSARGPKDPSKKVCPKKEEAVPLLVAPGEMVLSAFNANDKSYAIISGTSMSTPHVAGAVALLLSNNVRMIRTLTFENVRDILIATTSRNVQVVDPDECSCPRTEFPNNIAGNGLLDVLAAFSMACGKCQCLTA